MKSRHGFLAWTDDLTADERVQLVNAMPPEEARSASYDWDSWAHEGQGEPPASAGAGQDGWRTWVIMAGRGFGKTLAGAEWVRAAVHSSTSTDAETLQALPRPLPLAGGERLRIALVAATLDEARRVMVEGESGLLNVAGEWIEDWSPSLRRLRFTGGAEATLFSGASPEQLRGPQHHIAWCDELAKWEKPGKTWDMLQLGLRLGERPRVLVTTTPRPGPVLRRIMASAGCITTGGPTRANPHLSQAYVETVEGLYAGTRLGRQELDGELLTDTPGALWTVELLERCRLPLPAREGPGVGASEARSGAWAGSASTASSRFGADPPPTPPSKGGGTLTRVIIAVDPPTGDGTCGIVACARDAGGIAHILADHSVTGRSPEGWARAVADAALIHATRTVVAEQNQGGKMVSAVLRTADPTLSVRPVTATVGKSERAAPVAHLFEAGKVWLHGRFPELEAELMGMIAGGDYEGPGVSPDRADAMVWGITELMLGKERAEPRVRVL